jgi:membrane protein required for colicin V production
MSTLDLVLIVPLLYGTWRGWQKGLLLEIVSLLALFLGVLGALKLHSWGMKVLLPHLNIGLAGIAPYVVFLILLIGLVMGVHMLGKVLKTVLGYTLLGSFDNLGGALMGTAKMLFGLSLFVWASNLAGVVVSAETSGGSILYPVLMKTGPKAIHGVSYVLPFVKTLLTEITATLKG